MVLAAGLLTTTGCGAGHDKDGAASGASGTSAAKEAGAAGSGYPVSVTDCAGAATTFSHAPRKIVTSNAASLELLRRLGAAGKVTGTGFPPGKGTLPGALDAQAQRIKVLGDGVIPKE